MKKRKLIVESLVSTDRARAEQWAAHIRNKHKRARGTSLKVLVRVYLRTVRAGGASVPVWVVVASMAAPKEVQS